MECNDDIFNATIGYAYPISVIRITVSLLSIFGSTSIIVAVFLTGKLSSAEIHPLFTLSIGDFIVSCTWLFGGSLWLHNYHERSHPAAGLGLCYVLAIATTVISMVTFFLTVVYAAHAFIQMKQVHNNKGRMIEAQTQWWKHLLTAILYLVCWGLPLLLVLPVTEARVGLEASNDACWCFIDFFNTRPDNGNDTFHSEFSELSLIIASYIGTSFLISAILIIFLYILTLWYAWQVLKLQQTHLLESHAKKMIKKLILRASAFIGIFILCGFPAFAASVDVWNEKTPLKLNESIDKFILFYQAIFGPLQGCLNALVYGWSRKEFRRTIEWPAKFCTKFKRCFNRNPGPDQRGLINVRNDSPSDY